MTHPTVSRLASLPPLRRAAAGATGGFVACLAITWIERAAHLLSPLTNMGMATLDLQTAAVWAFLCALVFAGLRDSTARTGTLLVIPLPFLGLAAWLNASALRGPGDLSVLLPTLVLVLTVGGASALLGDRLTAALKGHATP